MATIEGDNGDDIVGLEPADAAALCPLSEEAGWNQVAADWRLMLALGQGFGRKGRDGGFIGSALILPLGPAVAWISMVLVKKGARGQGLGRRLLSRCLSWTEARGWTAGLDATEFGRPIYLPLGFVDVWPLSRWHWDGRQRRMPAPPPGLWVGPKVPADLAEIIGYDRARSGFQRAPILRDLARRSAPFAHVARRPGGAMAGYILGRDGHNTWQLGPLLADDEPTARALLSAAAAAVRGPLIIDIPDAHRQLTDWLAAEGASAPRRFMRMLKGGPSPIGDRPGAFALAGPELG
jgi:GNAT superfamily N-acetyltransferase